MYRTTDDGSKYASAAVSHRDGAKTSITYTYLGRVLDEKAGIYQNAKRGVFKFDPKTNTFSDTDASYVPPKRPDRRKTEHVSVDFGDAWFLNQFLLKSGFMKVVDSIGYGNLAMAIRIHSIPCCCSICSPTFPTVMPSTGMKGTLLAFCIPMPT